MQVLRNRGTGCGTSLTPREAIASRHPGSPPEEASEPGEPAPRHWRDGAAHLVDLNPAAPQSEGLVVDVNLVAQLFAAVRTARLAGLTAGGANGVAQPASDGMLSRRTATFLAVTSLFARDKQPRGSCPSAAGAIDSTAEGPSNGAVSAPQHSVKPTAGHNRSAASSRLLASNDTAHHGASTFGQDDVAASPDVQPFAVPPQQCPWGAAAEATQLRTPAVLEREEPGKAPAEDCSQPAVPLSPSPNRCDAGSWKTRLTAKDCRLIQPQSTDSRPVVQMLQQTVQVATHVISVFSTYKMRP